MVVAGHGTRAFQLVNAVAAKLNRPLFRCPIYVSDLVSEHRDNQNNILGRVTHNWNKFAAISQGQAWSVLVVLEHSSTLS